MSTTNNERAEFENFWRDTRGERKARRELVPHDKQPQTYISDSSNRHYVTWRAARASLAANAPAAPTQAEFALRALVAAGFVTQAKVNEAMTLPGAPPAATGYQQALDIRTAHGWKLGGDKIPVLYTDEINGQQVCRDDVWLCTTAAFAVPPAAEPVAWPKDAAEVRKFMHSNFISAEFVGSDESPNDDDRYLLSAHDFLSAVDWWTGFATDATPAPTEQWINAADMAALQRLNECLEDNEDWNVPTAQMKRMAELGVVRRIAANLYSLTAFGRHLIDDGFRHTPLETVDECNARLSSEHFAKLNAAPPQGAAKGVGNG